MYQKTNLSIIVPVYNIESYLRLCLNSILKQSYKDFEVILINDGSTDLSGEICNEFERIDYRVKVIHKNNSGVSAARNLGIKEASGKWITFVDGDDELVPEALSIIMNYAHDNYDLIEFAHSMVQDNKIITPNRKKEERIINKNSFYIQLFNYPWYAYHGYIYAKLYKKDILDKYNIRFDEKIFYKEDSLFVCQYVTRCNKILQSSEIVYKYFMRDKGAVATYNKKFDEKSYSHMIASTQIYNIIKEQDVGKDIEDAAKGIICYSYDLLKKTYKTSVIKNECIFEEMNKVFKKNITTAFYFKYKIRKGCLCLKRQIYLLLKFLKIKT